MATQNDEQLLAKAKILLAKGSGDFVIQGPA
jgi:hypothetical protein